MSNPCTAASCLNGNCPGCRNGNLFCNDPRCYPNCTDCNNSNGSNSNWILVTIILILLGILLILAFVVGFGWYSDRKKAGEPKNVTVNRHVHTNIPPPIVVQSPAPIVVKSPSPITVPTSSLQEALLSRSSLPIPSSSIKIPSSSIKIPSSSIKIPSSSIKIPSTGLSSGANLSGRLPAKSTTTYDGTKLSAGGIP